MYNVLVRCFLKVCVSAEVVALITAGRTDQHPHHRIPFFLLLLHYRVHQELVTHIYFVIVYIVVSLRTSLLW